MLVEDPSIAEYYLPAGSQWQRWSSTRNIVLPSGAPTGGPSTKAGVVGDGNAGTFAMYIAEGYFSLIALNFIDTTPLDRSIAADIHRNHHYHLIQVVPYGIEIPPIGQGSYVIWQYESQIVSDLRTANTGTIARPVTASNRRHKQCHLVPPHPPDDDEKYSYIERNLPYLTTVILIGSCCLIISQVRFETQDLVLSPFLLFTATYVIYQAISLPVNFAGRGFDLAAHQARIPAWQPPSYPDVDIYLPICGEPIELLRNTWTAVSALIEDYQGEARAYVLDDGPSQEARSMAGSFGFSYMHRPDWPTGKKAGNLRYAFSQTGAEYLVILDADFAPRRDFLAETLPYLDDPAIAIVQTPQYFRTQPGADLDRAGRGADPGGVLPDGSGGPPAAGRGRLLRDLSGLPAGRTRAPGRPDAHPLRRGRAHRTRCAPGRLVHGLPADPALDRDLPRQSRRVRAAAVPLVLRERRHRVLVAAVVDTACGSRPGWPTSPGSSTTPIPP